MEEGIKVAYSTSDAATQIKEKYAEITDILHVNGMSGNLCKYNGTDIKQFLFISADSTLTYIIHSGFISGYQNRYGDNLKPPTNVYHRMTA